MAEQIRFLSIDDVLRLHALAIEDQGGDPSLRDRGLLESAIAMPRQQFSGQYVHDGISAMAAAYAFHICKNHPFVDGNKRAGTAAMIAFLSDNRWSFDAAVEDAESMTLRLAAGEIDKDEWTKWVRRNIHEKPSLELRDFFSTLSLDQVRAMAESVVRGGRETEVEATTSEASTAIPLIAELDAKAIEIRNLPEGHEERDLAQVKALGYASVLLTALHRIAEDMGYEW